MPSKTPTFPLELEIYEGDEVRNDGMHH